MRLFKFNIMDYSDPRNVKQNNIFVLADKESSAQNIINSNLNIFEVSINFEEVDIQTQNNRII